jgi:hypothetical protein
MLLAQAAAPASDAQSHTLLRFGRVYNGRTMQPYRGKQPIDVLWPHIKGLECFALVFLKSGGSAAAGERRT